MLGRKKHEDEKRLMEEHNAAVREMAAAHENLARNHHPQIDVRSQALNLALAHANYISGIEANAAALRDFPGVMSKAETFLVFLLDDRVSE